MPARSSASTAAMAAVRRSASPWMRRTSATWAPMRLTGLSDTVGSCGMTPIWRPRIARSRRSPSVVRSTPSKRTEPPTTLAAGGSSPAMAWAVVDLPEPDSPTRASTSPAPSAEVDPGDGVERAAPQPVADLRGR